MRISCHFKAISALFMTDEIDAWEKNYGTKALVRKPFGIGKGKF